MSLASASWGSRTWALMPPSLASSCASMRPSAASLRVSTGTPVCTLKLAGAGRVVLPAWSVRVPVTM